MEHARDATRRDATRRGTRAQEMHAVCHSRAQRATRGKIQRARCWRRRWQRRVFQVLAATRADTRHIISYTVAPWLIENLYTAALHGFPPSAESSRYCGIGTGGGRGAEVRARGLERRVERNGVHRCVRNRKRDIYIYIYRGGEEEKEKEREGERERERERRDEVEEVVATAVLLLLLVVLLPLLLLLLLVPPPTVVLVVVEVMAVVLAVVVVVPMVAAALEEGGRPPGSAGRKVREEDGTIG